MTVGSQPACRQTNVSLQCLRTVKRTTVRGGAMSHLRPSRLNVPAQQRLFRTGWHRGLCCHDGSTRSVLSPAIVGRDTSDASSSNCMRQKKLLCVNAVPPVMLMSGRARPNGGCRCGCKGSIAPRTRNCRVNSSQRRCERAYAMLPLSKVSRQPLTAAT